MSSGTWDRRAAVQVVILISNSLKESRVNLLDLQRTMDTDVLTEIAHEDVSPLSKEEDRNALLAMAAEYFRQFLEPLSQQIQACLEENKTLKAELVTLQNALALHLERSSSHEVTDFSGAC